MENAHKIEQHDIKHSIILRLLDAMPFDEYVCATAEAFNAVANEMLKLNLSAKDDYVYPVRIIKAQATPEVHVYDATEVSKLTDFIEYDMLTRIADDNAVSAQLKLSCQQAKIIKMLQPIFANFTCHVEPIRDLSTLKVGDRFLYDFAEIAEMREDWHEVEVTYQRADLTFFKIVDDATIDIINQPEHYLPNVCMATRIGLCEPVHWHERINNAIDSLTAKLAIMTSRSGRTLVHYIDDAGDTLLTVTAWKSREVSYKGRRLEHDVQ